MDAGIADTINRLDAQRMAVYLDRLDETLPSTLPGGPWHSSNLAETLMGTNDATDADRAWLVGSLAAMTPGVRAVMGGPALCDWENLFSHFRAEVLARRDPKPPHARTAEFHPCVVV